MKQKGFLKPGLLRLILILIPLLALFSALTLISRHNPPLSKKDLFCPFMLIVLPPLKNAGESLHSSDLSSDLKPPFNPHNLEQSTQLKRVKGTGQGNSSEDLPSSPWLQDTRFFRSVLWDFNTGNYPSLELLFYLPLHFTKDNRWLVSTSPFPSQQQTLQNQSSRQTLTTDQAPQSQQAPSFPQSPENPHPYKKTPRLIFKEIQKQLSPHPPLTLKDLLDRFPNRKWFLHLMTAPPRDSLKNLKSFFEKSSALYITSHNEKLLKQLLEEEMPVIYDFKSLLRFQLLGIFLLEKLFSFPGQGLIIPSTLPLSLKTAKKLKYSGQWLFLKKETHITSFPEQRLRQVKGLITREGKEALKWIQDKNPCLQEN